MHFVAAVSLRNAHCNLNKMIISVNFMVCYAFHNTSTHLFHDKCVKQLGKVL